MLGAPFCKGVEVLGPFFKRVSSPSASSKLTWASTSCSLPYSRPESFWMALPPFGVTGQPPDVVQEHHDPLLPQLDPHRAHETGLIEGRLPLQKTHQPSFQRLGVDFSLFAKAKEPFYKGEAVDKTLPIVPTAPTESLVASHVADDTLEVCQNLLQGPDLDQTFCKVSSTTSIGHVKAAPFGKGRRNKVAG